MSLQPFQKVCGKKTDILSNSQALFPSHPALASAGMVQWLWWVKLLVPYHQGQGRDNELYWQALASSPLVPLYSVRKTVSSTSLMET